MILETKEQKQIFAGCLLLIIVLSVVSFWSKPSIQYKDTTDYSKKDQNVKDAQAYLDYLKTIKTDPAASKELFQTILTEDEIRGQVVTALGADLPVNTPVIDEKNIKISKTNDSASVNNYLSQTVGEIYAFNNQTADLNTNLLNSPKDSSVLLTKDLKILTDKLNAVAVPKDAVGLQKSLLTALAAYGNLLEATKNYDSIDYTANDAIWPQVYQAYAVSNDSAKIYSDELKNLSDKYKISEINIKNNYAEVNSSNAKVPFVKTAHAIFGIADATITIGDIPRIIMDSVKAGIQASFLQFMGTMLNKLITQIEKNYVIANFLYYSDALVSGQYAQDYLNKYVSDQTDRQIIKQFIPQFACGKKPQNLDAFFKAKAQVYLSFDPATLSPNDPDYYAKLARVGDFLASPNGWDLYYQDLATQTESAAQQAAQNEFTSSGLKTPRDISKASISKSINNIVSSEQASFNALLQMGINNSESIISQFVAKLTQSLVNQFVFSGVTGNQGGSIGVLKEQAVCLDVFQITPVVGISDTQYNNQPSAITPADAQAIQCSYTANIDAVCTQAIITFLGKCTPANVSLDLKTQCSGIISSAYVKNMLSACSLTPTLSSCKQLQSLLSQIVP